MWDALYFNDKPFAPDSTKSALWNRGAYLVQGPGHCAACHTPKSFLEGDKTDPAFQGYALQGWFAPNITDDDTRGLGKWSVADVVNYLKTGHSRLAGASGMMAEEVSLSSSLLTDPDLQAIALAMTPRSCGSSSTALARLPLTTSPPDPRCLLSAGN